ncbi:MAG: hypothetical protein JWQ08_2312 [Deinococcus sp.]|nr:hypothetical protein [Deinococcus sp.]
MNRWWPPLTLLTFALTACGQTPEDNSTSTTEITSEVSTGQEDWTWTPRLRPQALWPEGIHSLSSEQALKATNGWGPLEPNRSNGTQVAGDGRPLTLGGVKFAKGYGVHAPSELKYNLKGAERTRCVRFKAEIGMDDEVGTQGSAVFQVWGDTGKLFDSGVMTGASATQQVSVDLRGQSSFRMVVTDAGNGKSLDHADWVNPTLTCLPDMTVSAPEETRIYQDTHGTLPLTLVNHTPSFRGTVSYTVEANYDTSEYFQITTKKTRLTGEAQQIEKLNIYMGRQYTDDFFPADLVVWYAGEEVARTPLNLVPLEQEITVDFPDIPVELRVGRSVIVKVPVSVMPGGETTGARYSLSPNIGQAPDWLEAEIVGRGETPRQGGHLQVRFTATRNALPGEVIQGDAQFRLYEENFVHRFPIQIGTVPVRLIAEDIRAGGAAQPDIQANLP